VSTLVFSIGRCARAARLEVPHHHDAFITTLTSELDGPCSSQAPPRWVNIISSYTFRRHQHHRGVE